MEKDIKEHFNDIANGRDGEIPSEFMESVCPNCNGEGYTIEVEAVCCLNASEDGTCCGVPDAVQVQVPCPCNSNP